MYEVSFGAIVFDLEWPWKVNSRSGIFQRAVTWKPLRIRLNLLLMMWMMIGSHIWSFIWWHLIWPRVTWRGQIEVKHISYGCNLVTLEDTANLLLMMDRKSFPFICYYLLWPRLTWKGQIEVRHISEGRNLEPLSDTAKFIINDG